MPEPSSEQKTSRVLLRIPQERLETIDREAQRTGLSRTAFINLILFNYCKSLKVEPNGKDD